ncbi:MAG: anti-sigma factor domain-containing protein [Gemmatimonadota bacterium]
MSEPLDRIEELLAAEALGALDPADRAALEAALAATPEARRLAAEYREAAALIAGALPGPAPRTELRSRVLDRIAREQADAGTTGLEVRGGPGSRPAAPVEAVRRRGRAGRLAWLGLAASLAVAAWLGLRARRLERDLTVLHAELDQQRSSLDAARTRLAAREATLDAILEPGVQLHVLAGTGDAKPGIQLFWNRPKGVAILHAFNLKPAPAGRTYQLWFIPKDGKPMPSRTFNSEASGHALVQQIEVPAGTELAAAAITEEPEGGSLQPTSPILLHGSLIAE